MNAAAAFPVTDISGVAAPRRTALWLAAQMGMSEERAGRAALIVSELGTNLVSHARGGEILFRVMCSTSGERDGMEVVAVDKGPGLGDPVRSRTDGYSTGGSLGYGLGTVERQSDFLDLYTHTNGTAIVASLCRDEPTRRRVGRSRYEVGAIQVAKTGEEVCGDAWSYRMRDGRLAVLVADGLGHGLHAHEAALAALDVFSREHEESPATVIADTHAALRPTRGAAVSMLALDLERGTASYAGVGNIAGAIVLPGGRRHHLVSHNGTAGHTAGRIQEFNYPVPAGSITILASDGLGTHWDLTTYPGLLLRGATTIAAILYRDFSRRRDDVTVVVIKERPPVAEKL
jgi:anti-sigma regulatory factor (Ser/Thr protein kinase)